MIVTIPLVLVLISVKFSISCSSGGESSNQCKIHSLRLLQSFPVDDTSYLSYTGTSTSLELTEIVSTEVQVAELVTEIVPHHFYKCRL